MRKSGIFPPGAKRPQYDLDTVRLMSKGLNSRILSQVNSLDPSDEIVRKTWELTKDEIQAGYVWVNKEAKADHFILAKRFGLPQKQKVRMIDDCAIGGLNSTVGVNEKFRIHAVDEIAAHLGWCLDFSRKHNPASTLVGRTFDLKTAHKQYGIRLEDRDLVRIAVLNADNNQVELLGLNSLPFGSVGSVGAFLRVSLAVWYVGIRALSLSWSAYFDDCTALSTQQLAQNTTGCVEMLFDLLGIDFARDGSKATPFASKFKTLGVEIDLSQWSQGEVLIGHSADRRNELSSVLQGLLQEGEISNKQAESLRGRMHWFESFAFGRVANQAVKILGEIALRNSKNCKLNPTET